VGSNLLDAVALLSLILIGIALPTIRLILVGACGYVAAILAGSVRAFGVRPPPAAALLNA
jgi:hypothetical protein